MSDHGGALPPGHLLPADTPGDPAGSGPPTSWATAACTSPTICSTHASSSRATPTRPARTARPAGSTETAWPDPMCVISAMAAATENLLFTTGVYIAPLRDLMTVAKSVGTTAVLADNRLRLGVGVGWCKEEFDQTGQDFASRGKRLDEMIVALRALWHGGWVEFHGDYYDVPECQMRARPHRADPDHRRRPLPCRAAPDGGPVRRLDRRRRLHRGGGLDPPRRAARRAEEGRSGRRGLHRLPVAQRAARRRPVPPLRRCRRDRLRVRPVDVRRRGAGHARRRGSGGPPRCGALVRRRDRRQGLTHSSREPRGVAREDDEDRPADGLLGLGAAAQRGGARAGGRPPRLRLRLDGGVLRLRRPDAAGLVGFADRAGAPGHVVVPALGAHADRDGHGGADDGPPLGRPLRARPRRVGPPGGRGLVRPALPRAAGAHPRVRRRRAPGPRPREAGDQRRPALPAALSGGHRPGQAAQADRAPVAGRHADHLGGGGPEERRPGRRDRRRLVPHLLLPQGHVLLRGVARRGLRPPGGRGAARRTSRCWRSLRP